MYIPKLELGNEKTLYLSATYFNPSLFTHSSLPQKSC